MIERSRSAVSSHGRKTAPIAFICSSRSSQWLKLPLDRMSPIQVQHPTTLNSFDIPFCRLARLPSKACRRWGFEMDSNLFRL
jgi:hypothetical protein